MKGGEAEFALAVNMLPSKRALDREMGAFILGQLGTPKLPFREPSIPALQELLLRDPAANVRASAAASLGHLRASGAIDTLVAASTDADPDVRACIASALARFPRSKKARSCLDRLANDADEKVRYWAAD